MHPEDHHMAQQELVVILAAEPGGSIRVLFYLLHPALKHAPAVCWLELSKKNANLFKVGLFYVGACFRRRYRG